MRAHRSTWLFVWIAAATPSLAQDLLRVTTVKRTVQAQAWIEGDDFQEFFEDSEEQVNEGSELFQATARSLAERPEAAGRSVAMQSSEVLENSVVASGSIACWADLLDPDWKASAGAFTRMKVKFTLERAARFSLSGSLGGAGPSIAQAVLNGKSQGVVFLHAARGPVAEVGVLEPDEYVLVFEGLANESLGHSGKSRATADFDLGFQLSPLSGQYCPAARNSAGPGASLAFAGSQSVGGDSFSLVVSGCPANTLGMFLFGRERIQRPFGDGFLCVGGPVGRLLPPTSTDSTGGSNRLVDLGTGAFEAFETWNFQFWYRDPGGAGGSGFNTSDALWVTFLP